MSDAAHPRNSTNVRIQRAPLALSAARAGLRVLGAHAPGVAAGIAERLYTSPRRHARPPRERELLGSARRVHVPFRGGRLPVWVWTPETGGSAPTALLVHGWEGRGAQLGALVAPLLARGLAVVTWDAPAHGDASGSTCTIVDMAAAAARVAAYCGAAPRGTRAVAPSPARAVIAHSLGAAAALTATRFGLAADRFVMIAPPGSPARFLAQFEGLLGLDRHVTERMVGRLEDRVGLRFSELDFGREAVHRREPALFVHDREDREVPFDDGAALADRWAGARMLETVGLGHRRILRDPSVVREITAFAAEGLPTPRRPTFEETLEGELFYRGRRRSRIAA